MFWALLCSAYIQCAFINVFVWVCVIVHCLIDNNHSYMSLFCTHAGKPGLGQYNAQLLCWEGMVVRVHLVRECASRAPNRLNIFSWCNFWCIWGRYILHCYGGVQWRPRFVKQSMWHVANWIFNSVLLVCVLPILLHHSRLSLHAPYNNTQQTSSLTDHRIALTWQTSCNPPQSLRFWSTNWPI